MRLGTRGAEGGGSLLGLRRLYGSGRFRNVQLAFDLVTVLAFLALTFVSPAPWVTAVEATIGVLMLLDLVARMAIAPSFGAFLRRPMNLMDMVIVASLLVPLLTGSFAFLRVLRALRLLRALPLLCDLKRRHRRLAQHGELITSATNVLVFVFVTSSIVYELQVDRNPDIDTISDALYFTVTTLTTTGFGDITLVGESGRLLAVIIMIVGISLFVKLAQSIARPSKVHFECPSCGLSRHDADAVHCKHCGAVVHIETKGA